jgi:hypothetical protein
MHALGFALVWLVAVPLASLILAGLLADLATHFWHWLTHAHKYRP